MASNHIYPTTQSRLAGRLNSLVSQMASVRAEAEQLKRLADQIASGGDWQALADAFGYATPTEAETAYNLLGSALVDDLQGAFYTQMISRMG